MAQIVRDAGGRIVGRTKLQKIGYLLELAGVEDPFGFEYRHYGPYSENLTTALAIAKFQNVIHEDERPTSWGGFFSIFESAGDAGDLESARVRLIRLANAADSVDLELAATAAYLQQSGERDPWGETARRKPEKARDRLGRAKQLYQSLREIPTPRALPKLTD